MIMAMNRAQIMAHPIIQLPTTVELYGKPLLWTLARAEYLGWIDEPNSRPVAMIRVTETKYAGQTAEFFPEFLPQEIRDKVPRRGPRPFSDKLHKEAHPMEIDVLISDVRPGSKWPFLDSRKVDGWKMRDDFLKLEHSAASLHGFLDRYGQWDARSSPTTDYDSQVTTPGVVLPASIWYDDIDVRARADRDKQGTPAPVLFQDLVRWGLECGPEKWFSSGYVGGFSPVAGPSQFPHFVVQVFGCASVILATITIDHLSGRKFGICARHDCPEVYPIESNHKRSYCSQYCAHIESVRRSRRKA
jgi:hypothetical protein